MTTWDAELDRFEASLAAQRTAVAAGRPQDVRAFVPQALEPLPVRLAPRAGALVAQADALTCDLSAATAAAARQLQVVTVMRPSARPTSSYVDQRG